MRETGAAVGRAIRDFRKAVDGTDDPGVAAPALPAVSAIPAVPGEALPMPAVTESSPAESSPATTS